MRGAAAFALALDALLGEPLGAVHPTVWMGRAIAAARAHRRGLTARDACAEGAALVLGVALSAGVAALVVDVSTRSARHVSARSAVLHGIALKPALALRALLDAGATVESALRAGDLDRARQALAYHLVSRDTTHLSASGVAGAAISSLAENVSDSVVAPLLAYRIGGLAAAYAYRAINTADAMLGYRTPDLEWFGKPAALADDVANWIPARLSALLIAIASGTPRRALAVARADAGRTPSPNGGWPMAAMAGALGVRLVKRGVYALHDAGRPPGPADIARARRVTSTTAYLATLLVELA